MDGTVTQKSLTAVRYVPLSKSYHCVVSDVKTWSGLTWFCPNLVSLSCIRSLHVYISLQPGRLLIWPDSQSYTAFRYRTCFTLWWSAKFDPSAPENHAQAISSESSACDRNPDLVVVRVLKNSDASRVDKRMMSCSASWVWVLSSAQSTDEDIMHAPLVCVGHTRTLCLPSQIYSGWRIWRADIVYVTRSLQSCDCNEWNKPVCILICMRRPCGPCDTNFYPYAIVGTKGRVVMYACMGSYKYVRA
jgi:hypothetical protein